LGLAGALTLTVAGAVVSLLTADNMLGLLLLIAGPVAAQSPKPKASLLTAELRHRA
jgi:hypothetical protein